MGWPPPLTQPPGQHMTSTMWYPAPPSAGCRIYGSVKHSVLSAGVVVEEGATVEDAVLMDGVVVKAGAVVKRCILAEDVVVGAGAKVGGDGPIAHVGTGLTVGAGAVVKEGAKVFDSVKEGEEVC